MSYQVLARKWRPKRFQDVIGQSHITRSLQNALSRDKLGHAYILSGTRGIGKTSVARIFAKAIRCENKREDSNPCGECPSCLDFESTTSMNIVEIDGASNNSVDDIRDLIGNIQYLPTSGKYKIYIIDEVHMLSTSAFNALLKTLEEPPAHAIFILATTEPEKLLGTVLSRCQRFDFRNATVKDLSVHLKHIATEEGIKFEDDKIISQISAQGKGSVRDSLSLLDQVLSFSEDGVITEQSVSYALGLAKTSAIIDMVTFIINGDRVSLSKLYNDLLNENVSAKNICYSLLDEFYLFISQVDNEENIKSRWPAANSSSLQPGEIFWIYESISKDIIWTLASLSPERATEVALVKIALRNSFFQEEEIVKKKTIINSSANEEKVEVIEDVIESPPSETIEVKPAEVIVEEDRQDEGPAVNFEELSKVLDSNESIPVQVDETLDSVTKSEELLREKSVQDLPRSWDGFLAYLFKVSPAAASNLEQGNIINPLTVTESTVVIDIGFPETSKVFLDYLKEAEAFKKLTSQVCDFFNVEEKNVTIVLELVGNEDAIETDFKSKAEIKQMLEDKEEDRQKNDILNNPLIVQAQDIFNSKIDKVIIKKESK
ncbi:DNA polymerase III subunit gamma/tau [Halobacteriovorax sp. HLS]|uniref:DNA polymerase III subunit gamma/tau n=1 Tax=Halobacteriovorax sp. HLS TaxID=2234000 RepID=UPI000FD77074|nr:DNA polymerase III subunit gamma/tau [Halobacteriovorax sp. HLS]